MMSLLLSLVLASGPVPPAPPAPPAPPVPPAPPAPEEVFISPAGIPPMVWVEEGAYLGVLLENVDAEDAKELNLKEERGALVEKVMEDSPAEKAGLKKDDVILSMNGQPVESSAQLKRMIGESVPGRTARFLVIRDGKEQTLTAALGGQKGASCKLKKMEWEPREEDLERFEIRLRDKDDELHLKLKELKELEKTKELEMLEHLDELENLEVLEPEVDGQIRVFIGGRARLGVKLDSLTDQLGGYFGVKDGDGALITEVMKDTPAEKAGLKAGDIILSVDGEKIEDAGDVREILADKEGPVELTVLRDRKEIKIKAELEKQEMPKHRRHKVVVKEHSL